MTGVQTCALPICPLSILGEAGVIAPATRAGLTVKDTGSEFFVTWVVAESVIMKLYVYDPVDAPAMNVLVLGDEVNDTVFAVDPAVTLKKLAVNGDVPPLQEPVSVSYWPTSTIAFEAVIVGSTNIVLTPMPSGMEFFVTCTYALSVIIAFQDVPVCAVTTSVFVTPEEALGTTLNVIDPVML